nr:hypothetical protein [Sphingomonas sp. Y57]
MKLSDLIQVTDEKGFVTLHEPDEDGNAGDLVFSVWRDDWLSVLRPTDTAREVEGRALQAVFDRFDKWRIAISYRRPSAQRDALLEELQFIRNDMARATPSPVTDETLTDEVQRLIAIAYAAGCQAVHDNYQEDRDPDFSEAASDYARSIDHAALASTPQPAAETVEQAVAVERERCAKIADTLYPEVSGWSAFHKKAARTIAAAIRQSAKGGE